MSSAACPLTAGGSTTVSDGGLVAKGPGGNGPGGGDSRSGNVDGIGAGSGLLTRQYSVAATAARSNNQSSVAVTSISPIFRPMKARAQPIIDSWLCGFQ